jgi:hypothetical protein
MLNARFAGSTTRVLNYARAQLLRGSGHSRIKQVLVVIRKKPAATRHYNPNLERVERQRD